MDRYTSSYVDPRGVVGLKQNSTAGREGVGYSQNKGLSNEFQILSGTSPLHPYTLLKQNSDKD